MKKLLLLFLLTFSLGQSQTAAPTQPPRNTWDVVSVFAGAYSAQDIAGTDFNPNWGQASNHPANMTTPSYGGDPVKQYQNSGNYQGTRLGSDINVSAINKLHVDIYSPTLTSLRLFLIKTTGGTFETFVNVTLTPGAWTSVDIDVNSTTFPGLDLTKVREIKYDQFKIGAAITNNQVLIIDNFYFWRPATQLPPTVGTFTVPAQSVGAAPFTLSPPTSNNTSPFTYTSSNTNVATILGDVVTIVGAGTSIITALQVSDGSFGPSSTPATLTVSYPAPGPSPTPPARDPSTVVSMFTGTPSTYANVVNAIRAPWTAGTTMTTIPNGTNTCLQLDNFGYLGYITPGANFSVVGMVKLHVDIYLHTPIANMFIVLLAPGDQMYNSGPLAAGWNSLDISLSSYPGANLSNIYGIKFEQNVGPTRQIFLDNIYFYNGGTEPTITDFSVPAKVFGDAPFALTAPTSNSTGAFTYQSSNPLVATISGNMVTVTGIGTCTITANQAADGIYDAGAISAPLVVSAPPLATAAPNPPARNPWDVVSLYSNAYTNIPSTVWIGASSISDELLEGNDTKKFSNFLIELLNFAPTNVSEMTMLHMDIYTPDCPAFNIWLLNNGDRNAQIFPAVNGWRSIDIPLSTYSNAGLNLAGLIQLKFESLTGPGRTVYVDNIYFYRPATLPPATVGTFTVPNKNVGDANFTITPPTSNNTSPFVYTSSNDAIATIVSGDQIQVGTGGTCTITATQVSDGTYGPTLRTATFVVSFPAPGPSPIPPVREPSKVKSIYSAAYTTDPGFDMVRAFWTAGATLTTVPNGTDTALRADNLGYIGLIDSTERRLDVSTMTTLHLDVYVDAPFANLFFWLLTDGDQRRDITNLQAGWNSITINLSEFAGANLTNVYGFKFEQNQPSPLRFYLDNVYFSDDTVYADTDGDGYGNLASTAIGEQEGYVTNSDDCDDANPSINPGATDVCYDGIDNDCNGIIDNGCTPIVSVLQPSQCGITLSTINSYIYANIVPGAQGYRFRVTDMTTMQVQTIDKALRVFTLTQLPSYAFDRTYQVEVSIRYNNVWQPFYGLPCSITTPATTTQVQSSQCGATLTNMSDIILANNVLFATGYRFRVINLLSSTTQIIDRPIRDFRMNLLTNPEYNTTYSVEVAVKNTDGAYLPYGFVCNVTTPSFPTTSLQNSQCDYTAASMSETFFAISNSSATNYRFKFVNSSIEYSYTFDRPIRSFVLNSVPGLLPATTYSVQVSIQINGVFGPYGKVCSLTTPAAARTNQTLNDFKVIAYPNPFNTGFAINVTSDSLTDIEVKVYDMIGKLIENRIIESSSIDNLMIGERYPSGIYNVIVTQGDEVKTLRVIKR